MAPSRERPRASESDKEPSAKFGVEPLLTAREAAEILATTEGRLSQLRFHGVGPAYIKLGRSIRYRASDLESYIQAARHTPENR
jgi:hypothetical protein